MRLFALLIVSCVIALGADGCANGRLVPGLDDAPGPTVQAPAPVNPAAKTTDEMVAKARALAQFRSQYAANPSFRAWAKEAEPFTTCRELLREDGTFTDLLAAEREIVDGNLAQIADGKSGGRIALLTGTAFLRIWQVAETFRPGTGDPALKPRICRAIVHYGKLEHDRVDGWFRFHTSCFAIPTAAINIYFCFFGDMQAVENGTLNDPEIVAAHAMLRTLGYQAWTIPARNDDTDKQVVSVDRFRKHVSWVGGNGLTYRPALQAAIMMNSIPMMDVMAAVSKGALSAVSQTTFDDAFWTEGLTADGAGWGHGRQCLVWSYPLDGTESALWCLEALRGTPWAMNLERSQVDPLLNYLRGSSFYEFKGFLPCVLGRGNMTRPKTDKPESTAAAGIANLLLSSWSPSLSAAEVAELTDYVREAKEHRLFMLSQPAGFYHGSRYFFNNDDMIRKTPDYYVMVNMASRRVDGTESSWPGAAGFNFFTCDGVTLLQRQGNEYAKAIGAFNLTSWPGITTRHPPTPLKPVTNWRGYCSAFDFAAGATSGGDFAAGFIYQKINAAAKEGATDRVTSEDPNPGIYNVLAHKSWFMFGDVLLAMGAGITNQKPDLAGDIWTTLDQTCLALDSKAVSVNGLDWQINNGFAYAILPEHTTGVPVVKRESRTTKWKELCQANKGDEYPIGIFEMAINHGHDVTDATYAYVVDCAGRTDAQLPRILSNTPRLQAASDATGSSIGAVFFDKTAVLTTDKGEFRVSAPCALLIEYATGNRTTITVTDAKMDMALSHITVTTPFTDHGIVTIPMPTEPFRGKPASVTIEGGN